jgi:hypothetical protein
MALVTGTPVGTLTSQEDIYFEGAPTIYIQQYEAPELYSPDANGFYWGLSGTVTYPVYEIGCITDSSFTENLTTSDILCDNVGVKDTVQQRNYVQFSFTIQSFLPFTVLRHLLKFGTVTQVAPREYMPIGKINNNLRYHAWCPKVYDEDVGDYVAIMLHKVKFVDAWTINMPFGNQWQATGIMMRAFVDSTKPAAQQFGLMLRGDASVIT